MPAPCVHRRLFSLLWSRGGAWVVLTTCALLLSFFYAVPVQAQTTITTAATVLRDPIHTTAAPGPYPIPGAEVRYQITILGPDAADSSSGYRAITLNDNLQDDLVLADAVLDADGSPAGSCAATDIIRLLVTSADNTRAGEFCLTATTAGVTITGSRGSAFGQNVRLDFTLIPGVLPAGAELSDGGVLGQPITSIKGDLLPDEELLVEFNAVIR